MYAIIKTGGKQYKVAEGDVIMVEKLSAAEGEAVVFDEVLTVVNDGDVKVGKPVVEGAKVTGKVDKIMFREQYVTIREQSKYLSFNELEEKSKAIDKAKRRLAANAKVEDIMKLLIMTLKEI